MMIFGFDPGQSGGMAICHEVWGDEPQTYTFAKMTERDIYEALEKIRIGTPDNETFAMLENVHSMPKQGVASSFKFGQNFGFLRGLLIASGIPFEFVSPQKWQKAMGCLTHGDKNISKAAAQRLFPNIKVTHAIADALLIMEYARRNKK